MKFIDNNNLSKYTEIIKKKLSSKILEPTLEGEDGNILTIDSEGNRIWKDLSLDVEDYDESEILSIFASTLLLEDGNRLLWEDNTYILIENE